MTGFRSEGNDRDIELRVKSRLAGLPVPTLKRLDVAVNNRVAYVGGRVANFHQWELALDALQRVTGVHEIVDTIEVEL